MGQYTRSRHQLSPATVAARSMAAKKFGAVLSYRVAIARYCFRRAKKFLDGPWVKWMKYKTQQARKASFSLVRRTRAVRITTTHGCANKASGALCARTYVNSSMAVSGKIRIHKPIPSLQPSVVPLVIGCSSLR